MEAAMTIREDLIGLTYEDLENESLYAHICKGRVSWGIICDLYDTFMDHYDEEQLAAIIRGFTGKWPHVRNHFKLVCGVGSCIENRHYELFYRKPKSEKIIKDHQERLVGLNLRIDKPMVADEKKKKSKAKHRDVGDDVAEKLRGMSLEDMLAWEKELGADDATIEKHRNINQAGRARMSCGNKIRFLLRKKKDD